MSPADSALLFSNLAGAQQRSAELAGHMHCDGVNTIYWHECIQLTDGRGMMTIRPTGEFGTKPGQTALQQLTPAEIASLQPYSAVSSLLPPPA
jgi:hypothetical protein